MLGTPPSPLFSNYALTEVLQSFHFPGKGAEEGCWEC